MSDRIDEGINEYFENPYPPNGRGYKKPIAEADEDLENLWSKAHPSTREFWRPKRPEEQTHLYHKHPVLGMYGQEASKRSMGHTYGQAEYHQAPTEMNPRTMREIMGMIQQIQRTEMNHQQELIELAKDVTVALWAANDQQAEYLRSIMDARLERPDPGMLEGGEEEELEVEITPELQKAIQKRITQNLLIQGSAIDIMLGLWPGNENASSRYRRAQQMIENKIREMDPNLLNMYAKFASHSHSSYWKIPLPLPQMMLNSAVGIEQVKFDEEGQPNIQATAIMFPVLMQELSKAVMELLADNALMQSGYTPEQMSAIYANADIPTDEPYLIQAGPDFWRRLLKIVPKNTNIAQFILEFNKLPVDEMHSIVSATIEDPQKAKKMVNKLAHQEPEQVEPEPEQVEPEPDVQIDTEPEEDDDGSDWLGDIGIDPSSIR